MGKKFIVEYDKAVTDEEQQALKPLEDAFVKAYWDSLFWNVHVDEKGHRWLRVFPYSIRSNHFDQFSLSELKRLDADTLTGHLISRITVRYDQMGGMPCIRGLRIPVATIVGMIAEGMTKEEILKYYPDLEEEDIRHCLKFAAIAVRERELPLVTPT